MRTQRIARLALDTDQIGRDMELLPRLELSTAYSDYLCGGPWLSCVLWSVGAATGDGFLTHYEKSAVASWTPQVERLPAVRELVERNFHTRKLKFARLAMMLPGSVIIPHRDLLELDKPLHRLHVPLITDDNSFFSERNIVFRMRVGELWFLDASDVHSAACFSDRPRVHLILDFMDDACAEDIVSVPYALNGGGIDDDCIVQRPALTAAERSALHALSELLDERNHRKIVELVIHQHYRADGGDEFTWRTLLDIAQRAPNRRAADLLREMHRYFLLERSPEPVAH